MNQNERCSTSRTGVCYIVMHISSASPLNSRLRLWTRDRAFELAIATLNSRSQLWTRDLDFWTRNQDFELTGRTSLYRKYTGALWLLSAGLVGRARYILPIEPRLLGLQRLLYWPCNSRGNRGSPCITACDCVIMIKGFVIPYTIYRITYCNTGHYSCRNLPAGPDACILNTSWPPKLEQIYTNLAFCLERFHVGTLFPNQW